MTKVTKGSLKAEPEQKGMDHQLADHFLDYLDKCRENLKLQFSDGHDIDSEISIFTHHAMLEFDKFRTRRET